MSEQDSEELVVSQALAQEVSVPQGMGAAEKVMGAEKAPRFAVMASYWFDGLHNEAGIKLAEEMNATIKKNGLEEDLEAIKFMVAKNPECRKYGLGISYEEMYLNDPFKRMDLARPKSLLENALLRGSDGAYRPTLGGLAVLEDKGDSLLVKGHGGQEACQAAIELAKAKGWAAIELSGSKKMMSSTWLEAQLQGVNVVNYSPTKEDQERLAERLALRDKERAEKAGGVVQDTGIEKSGDDLVIKDGREIAKDVEAIEPAQEENAPVNQVTIEQSPEQVASRLVVDAEGQSKIATVTYTVTQETGHAMTFDNARDAAKEFQGIKTALSPAVVRSVTRVDGIVEDDVEVAGVGPDKSGNLAKSVNAVLDHEFSEAFAELDVHELTEKLFKQAQPAEVGKNYSGKILAVDNENGRVLQSTGRVNYWHDIAKIKGEIEVGKSAQIAYGKDGHGVVKEQEQAVEKGGIDR